MSELPRAVLVGQHRVFRESLAAWLDERERVRVVAQLERLSEVGELARRGSADLVLVDLSQPAQSIFSALQELAGEERDLRVVVLGLAEDRDVQKRCLEAGARGYVLQDASLDDLDLALERVLAGEVYSPPQVTFSMFYHLSELAREHLRREEAEAMDLTPREVEVLRLIAEGLSNREIAERICLSVYTVKNHVHNLLEKLEVETREAAVRRAHDHGWLRERRRAAG